MKIATKLALLNALVMGIFLIEGVLIFEFVSRVKTNVGELTSNIVPTLASIPALGNAFADERRAVQFWAAVPDAGETDAMAVINKTRAKMAQVMADYAKTIELDGAEIKGEDTRHYQELIAVEHDYETNLDKLLTIKENNEQLAFDHATMEPQGDKVVDKINELVKFNVDIGTQQSERATGSINQLYNIVIIISLAGSILALLVGALISHGIAKSLRLLQQQTTDIESSLDFSRRFSANTHDEIGVTATALNGLLGVVQGSLHDISDMSTNVGHRASELATNTNELSLANEMVSNATAAMAAAVDQVNVSISNVAERSQETRELAQQAGELAVTGNHKVTETIAKINLIAERANDSAQQVETLSQKVVDINTVVTTIQGIAEQTNLLALNAAIEAARAGDVGRGFAVVADEVRKLAERTATSTYEIGQTIGQIQVEAQQTVVSIQTAVKEIATGVDYVASVGEVVSNIERSTHQVVGSVNGISDAMSEQNVASTSMAREIEKIAQMTEETSANAMGVAEVGTQLNGYSQELLNIVQRYKV